ncbi:TIGR03790 family protein [Desulfococcaceae bacterium HSG9]|nr:TIGR03790 family protein [Desulfococcaceae bacterium HSG9]
MTIDLKWVRLTFMFFFIKLFLFTTSGASALQPDDILIVYNSSLPASKEVALYYQSKRNVPKDNLVGLELPDSENITYTDFTQKMVPVIKTAVRKFHADRLIPPLKPDIKTMPVLLLVYGMPLYIKETGETQNDQALKKLIAFKIKEYERLIARLTARLEYLAKKLPLEKKTETPSDDAKADSEQKKTSTEPLQSLAKLSTLVDSTVKRMDEAETSKKNPGLYIQISSVIIRLTGIEPAVKTIKKQLAAEKETPPEHILNQPLLKWDTIFKWEWAQSTFQGVLPDNAIERATLARQTNGIAGELKYWKNLQTVYTPVSWRLAAVDSELSLILRPSYQRVGWLPNPFFNVYNHWSYIKFLRKVTLMVARLDASTPELAKQMTDDAIEIENKGLEGVFYIDARGLSSDDKERKKNDYARFDRYLVNLHDVVKQYGSMPVVIDDKPELFQDGDCPDAALYCGWYSLAKYVDAFEWQKGAVGFHIASGEAKTLKKEESNVWCKRMLEDGVTATLGPVREPYLASFPRPDMFFPLLMTGKVPLIEVYYRTLPHLSWRQILIGDPLYTPFKNKPAIDLTAQPSEAASPDKTLSGTTPSELQTDTNKHEQEKK